MKAKHQNLHQSKGIFSIFNQLNFIIVLKDLLKKVINNKEKESEGYESPKAKSSIKKLKGNLGAISFKSETENIMRIKKLKRDDNEDDEYDEEDIKEASKY